MHTPRSIVAAACAVALAAAVPLAAGSARATLPPQCTDQGVNLYDYPASVAEACGFGIVPLERRVGRPDGGADYVYSVDGHDADLPQPPPNFDPVTASDAQLSYYGFPPRPSDPAAEGSWADEVRRLHVAPPTQFLIQVPTPGTAGDMCANGSNPVDLCWGGYVNTGYTFTASYLDYIEPGEAQSTCQNDAVLTWTGLGGFNSLPLAQDGTAPFIDNTSHYAFWEVYDENPFEFFYDVLADRGDDIRARVSWLSGSYEYRMTVTDTSTGATKTATWSPSQSPDLTTAEYIIERPQSATYIDPLRNFWTGWTVNSAQAATGGGNTIGMQNYPLTKENIFNKSENQLETTSDHSADHFSATWDACG